jgi:hypothetical protein
VRAQVAIAAIASADFEQRSMRAAHVAAHVPGLIAYADDVAGAEEM